MDPLLQLDYMAAGISHVFGRVDFYMTLASLLLPGSWQEDAEFRSQQRSIKERLEKQYRKILEFEMNCVCAAASAWNPAAKNVVGWHGLANLVDAIKGADKEIVEIITSSTTPVTRVRLLKSYKDLEPIDGAQGGEMSSHHMAAIAAAVAA